MGAHAVGLTLPDLPRTFRSDGERRDLAALADVPCLVILGEPGMGKTYTLGKLRGQQGGWHDLGIVESLKDATGEVFLDGLDEAPDGSARATRRLLHELPRDTRPRLTCRSAAWTPAIEKRFRERWPDLVVATLLPLEHDALTARGDLDFLGKVPQELLGNPLTLFLFWRLRNRDELPRTRREAFELGVATLFEEENLSHQGCGSPPEERMFAAERIAAFSVLCARWRLAVPQPGQLPPLDPALMGIDWDLWCDTLATAAFHVADATATWSHRVWAEFLAARFLSGLDVKRLRPLFEDTTDKRRVAAPLSATSGWLATFHPGWATWLVDRDPIALLGSEAALSDADKARLVDALLDGIADGSLASRIWGLPVEKLDHPGLPAQLEKRLEKIPPGESGRLAWILASGIAMVNHVESVGHRLAVVVKDPAQPDDLRVNAAYYFRQVPVHLDELKDLALGRVPCPPRLSFILLEACRGHGVLTTAEALDALQAKGGLARSVGNVETWAWLGALLRVAEGEDLAALIRHTAAAARDVYAPGFETEVMDRAVPRLEDPRIFDAVAKSLCSFKSYESAPTSLQAVDVDRRIDLALAAIRQGANVQHLGPFHLGLFAQPDFFRILARLSEAPALATVAWSVFRIDEPSHLDAALAAREALETEPRFLAFFQRWGTDRDAILVGIARARAEENERNLRLYPRREPPPLLDPPPAERVARALEECEQAVDADAATLAWWTLVHQLTLRPDSTHYGEVSGTEGDFTRFVGWAEVSVADRERIRDAALKVLRLSPEDTGEWLGTNTISGKVRSQALAFQALDVPPSRLEEIDADVWARLAPVVIHENRLDAVAPHAVREAPGSVAKAVDTWLERTREDPMGARSAAYRAKVFWSPDMADVVRRRLENPQGLSETTIGELLAAWLAHEDEVPTSMWDRAAKGNGTLAAAILLHDANEAIVRFGDRLTAEPDWGRGALRHLAEAFFPQPRWRSAPNEHTVAVLLGALDVLFPRAAERWVSGIMTGDDFVMLAWNTLVQDLSSRGTPEAVAELAAMDSTRFSASLAKAREVLRTQAWEPWTVEKVAEALERPVVRTDAQLLDLLVDTFEIIEREDLRSKTGLLKFAWLTDRPKSENDLSDLLQFLLLKRGFQVTREEQLMSRRGDSPGEHIDLLVRQGEASVIVEVKPNWSRELDTVMNGQLGGRYLTEDPACQAGLMLLAWYDSSTWIAEDRRTRARSRDRNATLRMLEEQAGELGRKLGKDLRVTCLDLRLEQHAP